MALHVYNIYNKCTHKNTGNRCRFVFRKGQVVWVLMILLQDDNNKFGQRQSLLGSLFSSPCGLWVFTYFPHSFVYSECS